MEEEPKQDLEKEMFELEQELDIPSHLRWHNSKPKQEITLEEFIKKQLSLGKYQDQESAIRHSIELGAKWQQEQDKKMYSEEDMDKAYDKGFKDGSERMYSEQIDMLWLKYRAYTNNEDAWCFKEWLLEQFKNK